mmetsp:Transcript_32992/g.50506  ORF Transcript_32992/g.50506 Transcript_32992/m.50506 type:complete len:137 (+) Transcript_32992:2540-2950(+)
MGENKSMSYIMKSGILGVISPNPNSNGQIPSSFHRSRLATVQQSAGTKRRIPNSLKKESPLKASFESADHPPEIPRQVSGFIHKSSSKVDLIKGPTFNLHQQKPGSHSQMNLNFKMAQSDFHNSEHELNENYMSKN